MHRILAFTLVALFAFQSTASASLIAPSGSGGTRVGSGVLSLLTPVFSALQQSKSYFAAMVPDDRYVLTHEAKPSLPTVSPRSPVPVTESAGKRIIPVFRIGTTRAPTMSLRVVDADQRTYRDPFASHHKTAFAGVPRAKALLACLNCPPTPVPPTPPPSLADSTGIKPWWSFTSGSIGANGRWMVNVASGNEMIAENDVVVPARGLDLTFSRVFNSMSAHDAANEDASGADIYGNRWTNTFDARLAYDAGTNTMIVYDSDGAKYVYTWDNGSASWVPPVGVYSQLVAKAGGCDYQWWKPDGTRLHFYAPGPVPGVNCGLTAGQYGLLWGITGRNHNNIILLTYTMTGDGSSRSDITKIVAQHSDGEAITLNFAMFGSNDELQSVERPDGAVITYNYDTYGNLKEVDKPAVPASPVGQTRNFTTPEGQNYSTSVLPETYIWMPSIQAMTASKVGAKRTALATGWAAMPEVLVCGPRAVLAVRNGFGTSSAPADGSCVDLYTDSYGRSLDIDYHAIADFVPNDGTNAVLQGVNTTWHEIQRVAFAYTYFDALGHSVTQASDIHGHATQWAYDERGRVLDASVWASSAATPIVTSQTWNDSNNRIASVTDARNNTTSYGYNGTGDVAAIQEPQVDSNKGIITPTARFSFDQFHNLVAYCDPVNSTATCTSASTATRYTYNYSDGNEPYGFLTSIEKPSGYTTTVAYNQAAEGGDYGLPTDITGASFASSDAGTPAVTPQEHYTYDNVGNVATFSTGYGNWSFNYDPMHETISRTEPSDVAGQAGVTSFTCYNADGSVYYTETAAQRALDGAPTCSPDAPAPFFADSYAYDADGNPVAVTTHYGETQFGGGRGITQRWYDGLDRLVEVQLPSDAKVDNNIPWRTRYLYDLTSAQPVQFNGTNASPTFYAYGNLYKTQNYFPAATGAPLAWHDISGRSFDGLDRMVSRYAYSPGNGLQTWTNSYDSSGGTGLLTSKVDPMGTVTTLTYDALNRPFTVSFSDGTPERTYKYDADGRPAIIAASNFSSPDMYSYDADGNETTYQEGVASGESSPATISYGYYPNGWRESLSISSYAITQQNQFTYNYRNDGARTSLRIAGIAQPFSWTYTNAARVVSESDPYTGQTVTPPGYASNGYPGAFTTHTELPRTSHYDAFGRLDKLELPNHGTYTMTGFDAEGEVTAFNASADDIVPGSADSRITGFQYDYDVRGELATIEATAPNPGPFATGTSLYGHACSGVVWGNSGTNMPSSDCAGITINNPYTNPVAQENVDPYTGATFSGSLDITGFFCNATNNNYVGSTLAYDKAGRTISDTENANCVNSGATFNTRSYDAENHLIGYRCPGSTGFGPACTFESPPYPAFPAQIGFAWGPNGKLRVATSPNLPNGGTATLHWDGNSLLFVTNSAGQLVERDIEMLGAIQSSSGTSYMQQPINGLVVNDHDFSGATVGMHFGGHDDFWTYGTAYQQLTSIGYLSQTACICYEYLSAFEPIFDTNGQRSDGYDVLGMIFQGPRVYDQNVQQWSTPDAYKGAATDPMTQRPYMWNRNNPVEYSDPSGNLPDLDFNFSLAPPSTMGQLNGDNRANLDGALFGALIASTAGDFLVGAAAGASAFAEVEAGSPALAEANVAASSASGGTYATEEGIAAIRSHLSGELSAPYNDLAIARIQEAFESSNALEGGDLNFYQHELQEIGNMGNGMSQLEAHGAALQQLGHSPFSVYAPEVISAFPGEFSDAWFGFWGIAR